LSENASTKQTFSDASLSVDHQPCENTINLALRRNRQRSWSVWLGLFALAGQIVLTLGHVHAGHPNGLQRAHSHLLSVQHDANDYAVRAATLTGHHRETPMAPSHLGGWCVCCWTLTQAASTILPTAACIRRAHLHQTFSPPYRTAALSTSDQASPFKSRGPPLISQD